MFRHKNIGGFRSYPKYYFLLDETGNVQNNERFRVLLSFFRIDNESEKETLENLVLDINNFYQKEFEGSKSHLLTVYRSPKREEGLKIVREILDKYKTFLLRKLLNFYCDIKPNKLHSVDIYMLAVRNLINTCKILVSRNSEINYSVENLALINTVNKCLKGKERFSDYFSVDPLFKSLSSNVNKVQPYYSVIPDIFVSGMEGELNLKKEYRYIKVNLKDINDYISSDRDIQRDVTVKFSGSESFGYNISFGLEAKISFSQSCKDSNSISQKIKERFRNFEIPDVFEWCVSVKSEADDLLSYMLNNFDFQIDVEERLNKKLDILKYIHEIWILDKFNLINQKILYSKFLKDKLPDFDFDKKVGDKTARKVLKIIFSIFDETDLSKIRELLNEIKGFDLIRYVCLSDVSYRFSKHPEIINDIRDELEKLDSSIPPSILELLYYDSIHQKLNFLYERGRFEDLFEITSNNISQIEDRINFSPVSFKRRYLNLFGKVLTEFYYLNYGEKVYKCMLEKLSENAEVKEMYRTRGSLAEVFARAGMYSRALELYEENYLLLEDEKERNRTISQMLIIKLYKALSGECDKNSLLEEAEDLALYYYLDLKSADFLYPATVIAFIDREKYKKDFEEDFREIASRLDKDDPAKLMVAIMYGLDKKWEDCINTLIEANFFVEALDLLNSSKIYDSVKLEDSIKLKRDSIKLKLKDYRRSIEKIKGLLDKVSRCDGISLEIKNKDFLGDIFSENRKRLLTFRLSLLNFLD